MIRLSFRLLMTNWIFLMLYQHLPSSPRLLPETDASNYRGVFETLLSFMIVITVGGILLIVFNGLFQPLYFQSIASSAAFLYFLMTRLTLLYKNDSAVWNQPHSYIFVR